MSAKGTSVKQDCRFKDKQSELLKSQFPESYYSGLVLKNLPKKPFEIYLRDILEAKFPQDQIAQDSAWNYVEAVWHQLYGPDFRKLEIDLLGVLGDFARSFLQQLIAVGLQAVASQDGIGKKVKQIMSRKLSVKQNEIRELDLQKQRREEKRKKQLPRERSRKRSKERSRKSRERQRERSRKSRERQREKRSRKSIERSRERKRQRERSRSGERQSQSDYRREKRREQKKKKDRGH